MLLSGNSNEKPKPVALQVIGAGLMRTGTTSLKKALEMLLQGPCYHMSTVACELKGPTIQQWLAAFTEEPLKLDFLRTAYQSYSAAIDYPTCAFYKTLMELNPNAKVSSINCALLR